MPRKPTNGDCQSAAATTKKTGADVAATTICILKKNTSLNKSSESDEREGIQKIGSDPNPVMAELIKAALKVDEMVITESKTYRIDRNEPICGGVLPKCSIRTGSNTACVT